MRTVPVKAFVLICFLLTTAPVVLAQRNVTEYPLPANLSRGLVKINFEYTPKFEVRRIGDSYAELVLRLNIIPSRSTDVKGNFSYRYLYNGKEYTDQDVGPEVFAPISFNAFNVMVNVMGPDLDKDVLFERAIGHKTVAKVPLNANPSDYVVYLKELKSVFFTGTSAIENKIRALQTTQKNAAAEKQKQQTVAAAKPTTNQPQVAYQAAGGQDDFWETGKKSTTANSAAASKTKQQSNQEAADALVAKLQKDQAEYRAMREEVDRKINLRTQSYVDGVALQDARENLKEASTLSGSYQSVDELMADFKEKMRQVNSAVSDLTEKKNQAWNSSVDASFSGPDDAAMGAGLKAIGNIVNAAKEEKERKKAREELKLQKELLLNEMAAEEKRLLSGIRTDLFAQFKEGALPLSSTKLKASTIYYFIYAYDPAQIGSKQPLLYVSNVFAVNRYSDGTWPFKTTLKSAIDRLTPYSEVMHGYYTNEREAEARRQGMMDIFGQSGGLTKAVAYKSKKTTSGASGASSDDFWETGKKPSAAPQKKPAKKDDFWNN